ncbi:site-specific integrase [Aureibaculum sp. 2210JD6-5]|uniref:site-specific integrase n=1 Tax=Aureibaculum sp. 2210JD6-5 TaxID=3103957 RepID=UPI002AADF85A|nr:site-specific integrase [Aureibaculum sp. 2210JD6-5]MDY7396077.1 site-specific integrase [Aureibaculum sp. 2210JD6-5]
MRTSNLSITFWQNVSKKKRGNAPLYARITTNGKRLEISLGRSIPIKSWSKTTKRMIGRSKESHSVNAHIEQVYLKLLECQRRLNLEKKTITPHAIKTYYYQDSNDQKTLMDLIDYHNRVMLNVIKPSTLSHYFTTKKYLIQFMERHMNSKDINLNEISFEFLSDFEAFLRKKSKLNHNGVMKHLTRLKKLINLSIKLEWLIKSPFINFKIKFIKKEREILNKSELVAIENATFDRSCLEVTKDMFIFSCYTGLSYIDIKQLNINQIVKGNDGGLWIKTKRAKTNIPVKIPLLNRAHDILNKYSNYAGIIPSDAVLPIYSNQKTNQYLKDIADILDIQKRLTFHVARHTFATLITLSNGVPIETVAKLLGHTKLTTTQIYARVLDDKISKDMKIVQEILNKNLSA